MAKYKRTNLGTKENYEVLKQPKNKVMYPNFYIKKKLSLVEKDVGKTFEVKAKIKLTGLNQSTNENKNDFDYSFDIINIEF